jgi:hypothetical protein
VEVFGVTDLHSRHVGDEIAQIDVPSFRAREKRERGIHNHQSPEHNTRRREFFSNAVVMDRPSRPPRMTNDHILAGARPPRLHGRDRPGIEGPQ